MAACGGTVRSKPGRPHRQPPQCKLLMAPQPRAESAPPASVAQRIEQEPSNLLVGGSIPSRGTQRAALNCENVVQSRSSLAFRCVGSTVYPPESFPRNRKSVKPADRKLRCGVTRFDHPACRCLVNDSSARGSKVGYGPLATVVTSQSTVSLRIRSGPDRPDCHD